MARLEEVHDDGGRRYYLGGQPISCGQVLEVSLEQGWLPVRFEMDAQQYGVFYLRLGSGWDNQVSLRLPDTAELRWPPGEAQREETLVRKLRRTVEELAEMVSHPEEYSDDERELALLHARGVLRATAPRLPEEPGRVR
ncbi:hypothetical protein DEIPH_ctg139orf0160 [Deinococcus phoenicis]|uniref:Uncharacterized protein n=1 Tax=Deinococcus phoenicis TaxID=1476583 RepID=A0A016QKW9_9DEIO|nr:DUF5348 domain-containing protein [Deinococcus phoenicis]EYB66429.1 hypothetical protein DEIPH_ctg139orf0160 [Deinococcus phoenicis]